MSFLEHLEALRWHLVRSVAAVVLFGALAFVFSDLVFDGILLAPKYDTFPTYRFFCWLSQRLFSDDSICLSDLNFQLISTQMSGQFTTHLMVAFATGLVLAFPYLLWEIWHKAGFIPRRTEACQRDGLLGIVSFRARHLIRLFRYYSAKRLLLWKLSGFGTRCQSDCSEQFYFYRCFYNIWNGNRF